MIYLDNAATSFPKPEAVYQSLDAFARHDLANPGRAGHKMALAAERALDDCRHLLNQLFHGEGPERFIFTLNCTDALNMAFKGVLKEGDHVITTDLEHNSVSRPLRAMELAEKITLTRIAADKGGTVDPDAIKKAITPKTRLVALTHASNVLGTVQPIDAVGKIAREREVLFLVDAAQTAGVIPIDIQATCIDLLAFPGHKSLLGPTGTGALYVGPGAIVGAWREGGTGGDSKQPVQPSEFPHVLEGGTPNVHGIVGLIEGVRFVQQRGIDAMRDHELKLIEQIVRWAEESKLCQVAGKYDPASHVATVSLINPRWETQEVAMALDEAFEICVRPGLHCAPYAHQEIGSFPDGTIRISPGCFNTPQDVTTLCNALAEIARETAA